MTPHTAAADGTRVKPERWTVGLVTAALSTGACLCVTLGFAAGATMDEAGDRVEAVVRVSLERDNARMLARVAKLERWNLAQYDALEAQQRALTACGRFTFVPADVLAEPLRTTIEFTTVRRGAMTEPHQVPDALTYPWVNP
jgi:hypothetical protein